MHTELKNYGEVTFHKIAFKYLLTFMASVKVTAEGSVRARNFSGNWFLQRKTKKPALSAHMHFRQQVKQHLLMKTVVQDQKMHLCLLFTAKDAHLTVRLTGV